MSSIGNRFQVLKYNLKQIADRRYFLIQLLVWIALHPYNMEITIVRVTHYKKQELHNRITFSK